MRSSRSGRGRCRRICSRSSEILSTAWRAGESESGNSGFVDWIPIVSVSVTMNEPDYRLQRNILDREGNWI